MPEIHPAGRKRESVAEPPAGWSRLKWFGPGLLWMVASVGSGSVLFTPRVGSRYRFDMLWIALLGGFLTWVIIKEIGRYTVVTGKTILEGYGDVHGPKGWAIWIIFLPGIASGIVMVAGISALVASALMIALPGGQLMYGPIVIIGCATLVLSGHYATIEKTASLMAAVLVISALVTAVVVFPGWQTFTAGLVPVIPSDFDAYFVLPWVGFLLAGAAGVMWFSYWVAARGMGGPVEGESELTLGEESPAQQPRVDAQTRMKWLRRWMIVMAATAALGVVTGTIVNISFLTLGAELLAPLDTVPEGIGVAEDLAMLLSEVWGRPGFWLLIISIVIALTGSVLANQDGWGRMFADATRMLLRQHRLSLDTDHSDGRFSRLARALLANHFRLKRMYVVVVLTGVPLLVFFLLRDPVRILSIGGIISAAHMPVVVLLTLHVNRRHLPEPLRPGFIWSAIMILVGLYYAIFAGFYFYGLLTGRA